jgi:hypothetical protein
LYGISQGPFDLSLPRPTVSLLILFGFSRQEFTIKFRRCNSESDILTDYKRMRIPRPRKIDDGNSIVFFIKEVFLESENVVIILDFIIQAI